MDWNLEEAIAYYKKLGAPADQTALTGLLREIQTENGGTIPSFTLEKIAQVYGIKESLLLAIIKRIPSLRLENTMILQICAGVSCGKHTELVAHAEKLHRASGKKFTVQFGPCMRMCGKGPNVKCNGQIYHKADKALLERLLSDAGIDFPSHS